MSPTIWIGFDSRESASFTVTRHSLESAMCTTRPPIYGLVLSDLQRKGLYTRPLERRKSAADGPVMWDTISDEPMATEHACARFLVPRLARTGWAVFMDGDMLVRKNLWPLIASLDPKYALYCVQHKYEPKNAVKMDGQKQTKYQRKNWSSFMIFNCDHHANRQLTVSMVNSVPGRELHRFCWLEDEQIGALPPEYNYLVGDNDPIDDPAVVHFTNGTPDMKGYENEPFADEWRACLANWARGSLRIAA